MSSGFVSENRQVLKEMGSPAFLFYIFCQYFIDKTFTFYSLEEARQKRQDEWEKVRKAEDPKDAPEEPYGKLKTGSLDI